MQEPKCCLGQPILRIHPRAITPHQYIQCSLQAEKSQTHVPASRGPCLSCLHYSILFSPHTKRSGMQTHSQYTACVIARGRDAILNKQRSKMLCIPTVQESVCNLVVQ